MINSGTDNNIRMQIVFYGRHTPIVDSTIALVRPSYLIGNPAHGLWGEVYGYNNPGLLQDVTGFQQVGIKVIGYLTAGYEGRGSGSDLETRWCQLDVNRKLITNMAYKDGVNGVFIDEGSKYPDELSRIYLKELVELAHSYGLMVWGNVGVDDFDEWFFNEGDFDMMNTCEIWQGQTLTPIQEKWGSCISVTGFDPAYTVTDAYNLIRDASDKGLACSYISNDEYLHLPAWIQDVASLLRTS